MGDSKDKPRISPAREDIMKMVVKGEKLGHDGGKPRTPVASQRWDFGHVSGKPKASGDDNGAKRWEPPKKDTTPSNRKKQ